MMETMTTRNVNIDDALVSQLDALAQKSGKGFDGVIADAAREYIAMVSELAADVHAGIADADAGRVSSIDDVEQRLSAKLFPSIAR
jgi:predicted transcriptional regulator